MALSTFVKINQVNNLSDARYCAGMEVNLMGFCLEPGHARHLQPIDFVAITEWISGVEYVGEFYNSSSKEIIETAKGTFDLKWVETNNPDQVNDLSSAGLKVILQCSIEQLDALSLDHLTFDLLHLVSAEETDLDTSKLQTLCKEQEVLLGHGFDHNSVLSLIESIQPKGISITGGDEIRPGYKDYDEMADTLEALEIDEWA